VDTTLLNDDHNSQIHFSSLQGLLDNLPIKAVVTLTDLKDPTLDLKATFDVALKDFNEHLDTTKIKMTAGHFVSNFIYSGKLHEYLDETKNQYEGKLLGEAKITDGQLLYLTKRITLDGVQATFGFTEKEFEITNLALK
jgi:hypothetical protein